MSNKIRLDIIGLSTSQTQSGAYALILGETEGKRRLPIIIGAYEAQAIAFALERAKPNRPLTHDLVKNLASAFTIQIQEVVINKFVEGVFYALLVCSDGKDSHDIDSRTSDAVALALRFRCPIYALESVLEKAGIVMDANDMTDSDVEGFELSMDEHDGDEGDDDDSYQIRRLSFDELQEALNEAVTNEEYEKASKIRDELKRRGE